MKPSKSIFGVWLCLMVLFVGFIVFFDWYGEVLMLRAREVEPANAYEYAMEYLEEGRLEEAAEKFEISLEFAKRDTVRWPAYMLRDARLNLGEIYYQLGEYDKAQPYLEQLLLTENAPGLRHGVPLFHLAEIYLRQGEKEKAAKTFRMTTEWNFDPTSAKAFFRLGELAAEAGDYNAAVENLDMAVTLDAGEVLDTQMWDRIAAIGGDAARSAKPKAASVAQELIGISKYRQQDFEACVAELEAALKAGRDTPRVHYFMAKAYEALGASEKAQQHLALLRRERVTLNARDMLHTAGRYEDGIWVLVRNSALRQEVFLANEIKRVEVVAKGASASFVGAKMVVRLEGATIGEVEVSDTGFEQYAFAASVSREHGLLEIEFTNDYRDPDTGEDRNLYVEKVVMEYGS
jgi:tetratricopeptide (TPR) repeat protein